MQSNRAVSRFLGAFESSEVCGPVQPSGSGQRPTRTELPRRRCAITVRCARLDRLQQQSSRVSTISTKLRGHVMVISCPPSLGATAKMAERDQLRAQLMSWSDSDFVAVLSASLSWSLVLEQPVPSAARLCICRLGSDSVARVPRDRSDGLPVGLGRAAVPMPECMLPRTRGDYTTLDCRGGDVPLPTGLWHCV